MASDYEDVEVDGKYTIRMHRDGTVEARRYDSTWIPQVTAGANMVRAFAVEVGRLRTEITRVTAERDRERRLAAMLDRASVRLDIYNAAEAQLTRVTAERDALRRDLRHVEWDQKALIKECREQRARAEEAEAAVARVEAELDRLTRILEEDGDLFLIDAHIESLRRAIAGEKGGA